MEFPKTGSRCSLETCQRLDFLPFTCDKCRAIFCKEHFHVSCHRCCKLVDQAPLGKTRNTISAYHCSEDSCRSTSSIEIPCAKCARHFCIAHRYHGCAETSEAERLGQLKKWQEPQERFSAAKAQVDREVKHGLRKAKNASMANKVQLMKLKGRASGDAALPQEERRYFLVYPPLAVAEKVKAKETFVSVRWSVGKVIDSMATMLSIPNSNNLAIAEKLRLFDRNTGNLISQRMDVPLSQLLEKELQNGQDVVLEYCSASSVDGTLYK